MIEQVDEHRLGPLQVVDHEHQRALGREHLHEAADRPSDLFAGHRLVGQAHDRRDAAAHEVGPIDPADDRVELDDGVVAWLAELDPGGHLDELADRPISDPIAVRQTARAQDRGAIGDGGQGLGDEPALADTRRASDGHEPGRGVGRYALEGGRQRVQVGGPADERGGRPTLDRLGLAEGHKAHGYRHRTIVIAIEQRRLGSGRTTDEALGLDREQDLVTRGTLGEHAREMERDTGHQQAMPVAGAGEDLPGGHPDAEDDLRDRGIRVRCAAQLGGSPDGTHRVILARDREAENGGDAILSARSMMPP